jgi:hypothetical protein
MEDNKEKIDKEYNDYLEREAKKKEAADKKKAKEAE